jgi:hypothetical protein
MAILYLTSAENPNTAHTHMEITPNYLAMRIEDFHKRKADAHAEYLGRRELWQALQEKKP